MDYNIGMRRSRTIYGRIRRMTPRDGAAQDGAGRPQPPRHFATQMQPVDVSPP